MTGEDIRWLLLGVGAAILLLFVILRFFTDTEAAPAKGPGLSDRAAADRRITLLVEGLAKTS